MPSMESPHFCASKQPARGAGLELDLRGWQHIPTEELTQAEAQCRDCPEGRCSYLPRDWASCPRFPSPDGGTLAPVPLFPSRTGKTFCRPCNGSDEREDSGPRVWSQEPADTVPYLLPHLHFYPLAWLEELSSGLLLLLLSHFSRVRLCATP